MHKKVKKYQDTRYGGPRCCLESITVGGRFGPRPVTPVPRCATVTMSQVPVLPWRVRSDGRHRCPQAHLWTPGTNKGTRMSHSTLRRRFAAGLTAVATAAGLVVGAPALVGAQPTEQGSSASLGSEGPADAPPPPAPAMQTAAVNEDPLGNRAGLRPGCEWAPVRSWVQLCTVHSPAMNRD